MYFTRFEGGPLDGKTLRWDAAPWPPTEEVLAFYAMDQWMPIQDHDDAFKQVRAFVAEDEADPVLYRREEMSQLPDAALAEMPGLMRGALYRVAP